MTSLHRHSTPRFDRYAVDGIHRPQWRRARMDIPTEDSIRPALVRGLLIGLAIVAPFWLMFGLAWVRWGF